MKIILLIAIFILSNGRCYAENSLPTLQKNTLKANISNPIKSEYGTEVEDKLNNEKPEMLSIPAALVRYRREPPITIIKHRVRKIKRRPKPRRRIKQPKTKYGPPDYKFNEPLNYYKPTVSVYESYNSPFTSSSTNDEYENFKKEFGSDLNIQGFTFSEYDTQPINFDFYDKSFTSIPYSTKVSSSSIGSSKGRARKRKKPTYWQEITETPVISYEYEPPQNNPWNNLNFQESQPKLVKPKNEYSIPSSQQPYWENLSETQPTAQLPHLDYGIPLSPSPPSPEKGFQLPEEIPKYNFAEPPVKYEPSLTYEELPNQNPTYAAPAYLPPTPTSNQNVNYEQPQYTLPEGDKRNNRNNNNNNNGYYAEPSPSNQEVQPSQENGNYQEEQSSQENGSYFPHYQQELPLENKGKSPYEYPKTSYEVPLYNSIPFNPQDSSIQEHFPPLTTTQHRINPGSSQPAAKGLQNGPSKKISIAYNSNRNAQPKTTKTTYNQQLNQDNVSRESSHVSSLHTFSTSLEELIEPPAEYLETLLNTSITLNRRKRKRVKPKDKTQHILDTDELKQAFGSSDISELRVKPDESSLSIEDVPENFVLLSSTNNKSGESEISKWNPMKIKNNDNNNNVNSTITHTIRNYGKVIENNNNQNISNNGRKSYYYNRNSNKSTNDQGTTKTLKNLENKFKGVQVISIEKSRSRSYYAGTMSPQELMKKYPGISAREDITDEDDDIISQIVKSDFTVSDGDNDSNSESIERKIKGEVTDDTQNLHNDEEFKKHQVFFKNHRYF